MRNIYLTGEINRELSNRVIRELLYYDSLNQEVITIYISSNGGEVDAGLSIIDIIYSLKSKVNMVVLDKAHSMAAIILSVGAKRYCYRNSIIMIHNVIGNSSNMQMINSIDEDVMEVLTKSTGKTYDELSNAMSWDNFMNAQEAKEMGFIDEII